LLGPAVLLLGEVEVRLVVASALLWVRQLPADVSEVEKLGDVIECGDRRA